MIKLSSETESTKVDKLKIKSEDQEGTCMTLGIKERVFLY